MKLRLEGIDVACVIGDRPDERDRLQRLRVDVELSVDDRAAESDDLRDTADYAALTESIRTALMDARCRLVERAAKIVHGVCMSCPHVSSARASVTKAGAVPHLASATAVIGG